MPFRCPPFPTLIVADPVEALIVVVTPDAVLTTLSVTVPWLRKRSTPPKPEYVTPDVWKPVSCVELNVPVPVPRFVR